MTSFRVIRQDDSARKLREQMKYDFRRSDLRDRFHPPFPATAAEYVRRYGSREDGTSLLVALNTTILSKLPHELLDLILSKLTPAALVAARCTCRAWWEMIMSNEWVLASVLGFGSSPAMSASLGNDESDLSDAKLRRMHKELSRRTAIYTDYRQPDFWPLRFRKRTISFSMPQVCEHGHGEQSASRPTFIYADFSICGRFMVLLTGAGETPSTWEQNNVLLYQLALSGQPLSVGSLVCPRVNGLIRAVRAFEVQPSKSWLLTIVFESIEKTYSIATREAYAYTDTPFVLEDCGTENAPETLPLGHNIVRKASKELLDPRRTWQIVTYLPSTTADTGELITKQALAKHIASGTLWVVWVGSSSNTIDMSENYQEREKDPQDQDVDLLDGAEAITAVALIVPPKEFWIYRNVAAASRTGPVRVAVIWQDIRGPYTTELYFHDIPFEVLYKPREESSTQQRNACLQRLTAPLSAPMLKNLDSTGLFVNVLGRRVQSLDLPMGGIHSSSPIWTLPMKEPFRKLNIIHELGGLQITVTVRGPYDTFIDSRKCFVWGPSALDEQHLSFAVFDFSYEGATKLLSNFKHDGIPYWQHYPVNPHDYGFERCACAFHDDGYNIVLPDTACAALLSRTGSSQQGEPPVPMSSQSLYQLPKHFPQNGSDEYHIKAQTLQERSRALFPILYSLWTTPAPAPLLPAPGSIEHYNPPARKEALERRDEELREVMRTMKRDGFSNSDIWEAWCWSKWSGRGGMPKPDGWQDW